MTVAATINGQPQTASVAITVTGKPRPPYKNPSKVTDPLVNDPLAQHVLDSLGMETHWGKPLADQEEVGGFFVRDRNGVFGFVAHDKYNGIPLGPCLGGPSETQVQDLAQDLKNSGYPILGQVHTHPRPAAVQPDPRNCWTLDQNGMLKRVPQQPDGTIQLPTGISTLDSRASNGATPPTYNGYLLDPQFVYVWDVDASGKYQDDDFRTNRWLGRAK